MWHTIERTLNSALSMTGHMGREQWIAVFVVALALGVFLLRGFGSQRGY
jgi:hypothetical protein